MPLSDIEIIKLCEEQEMITPFHKQLIRVNPDGERVISYGVSSFGYDMTLGEEYKIYEPRYPHKIVDPKKPEEEDWRTFYTPRPFGMEPGTFLLARTVETWNIPEDIMVTVLGKSTYARCGLIVNVTPMEPGWKGVLTLELHNASRHRILIYPNEGIAQAVFQRGKKPSTTYAQRQGKYQDQTKTTLGTV